MIKGLLFWLVDALVFVLAGKNAAWSIVLHRYGEESEWLSTIGWYLLALGYLVLATRASTLAAGVQVARPVYMAYRLASAAGAGLALAGASMNAVPSAGAPQIHQVDWLLLAFAFAWCALLSRAAPTTSLPSVNLSNNERVK